jgi:hypothetical protein
LRMPQVADRSSTEHRLCQESFAPYGDEASRIQERRVKGPESQSDRAPA